MAVGWDQVGPLAGTSAAIATQNVIPAGRGSPISHLDEHGNQTVMVAGGCTVGMESTDGQFLCAGSQFGSQSGRSRPLFAQRTVRCCGLCPRRLRPGIQRRFHQMPTSSRSARLVAKPLAIGSISKAGRPPSSLTTSTPQDGWTRTTSWATRATSTPRLLGWHKSLSDLAPHRLLDRHRFSPFRARSSGWSRADGRVQQRKSPGK